jgi:uncharacterized membrane protein
MATLTAVKFNTSEGAEQLRNLLLNLQRRALIQIQDAVAITWPQDKKRPGVLEMTNLAGLGAINGEFWGFQRDKSLAVRCTPSRGDVYRRLIRQSSSACGT